MTDTTHSEPTLEDCEPASFAEATKSLFKKHKPRILAVGALGLAVVGVVARYAMEQGVAGNTMKQGVVGDAEDRSVSDLAAVDDPRKSPDRHPVVAHERKLADGRVVPVAGYERGRDAA